MASSTVENVRFLVGKLKEAGVTVRKVLQGSKFLQLIVDEGEYDALPVQTRSRLRAGKHGEDFCVYVHHEQVTTLFDKPRTRVGRVEKVKIQGKIHEQLIVDVRVPGIYMDGQFTLANNNRKRGGGTVPYDS